MAIARHCSRTAAGLQLAVAAVVTLLCYRIRSFSSIGPETSVAEAGVPLGPVLPQPAPQSPLAAAPEHVPRPLATPQRLVADVEAGADPGRGQGRGRSPERGVRAGEPKPSPDEVPGGALWPFQRPGAPDVWVHWVPPRRLMEEFVYMPVFATLGEAFWSLGASVALTNEYHCDALLANVSSAAAAGHLPILVAIGFWSKSATTRTVAFLEASTRSGAYLVLYQSEQFLHTGNAHVLKVQELVERYRAKEVWDFTHSNMDFYRRFNFTVKTRYVPTGYSSFYDLGVSMDSPSRKDDRVGFLGGPSKRKWTTYKKIGIYSLLHIEEKARTWGALRKYMEVYPMQLNVHHFECNSAREPLRCPPLETFRMSFLLANKACVISARSHPGDEEAWRDIVHFEDVANTMHAFQRVKKNVRGCQESAHEAFKAKFAPTRLLTQSGFL
eukprot:CAMPEP_0117550408 /NCGR_PEP_ID=MMETSP0784-20121206/48666_1 /TAXON_ID=39447 /ORGANISM="" /LENGTH=440 /DNA_ID=CAMNT_0005347427 /DNA_START=57 /DNA_END=1376 /DNA_ORIENTATION=+